MVLAVFKITLFIIPLLHATGSAAIALPYDVPFAKHHVAFDPCKLPLVASSMNRSAGSSTVEQLIHHDTPELGSFSQFFLWNSTFWRPGAPIVVFLPGETGIERYGPWSRPDFSTVGVIAEHLGAAVILLEHRYYGSSSPYKERTKSTLQYLTVDNALKDVVNFANNFIAPWTDIPTTAKDVPWILVGGSYSAAQTAWIANIMPGTFWAYLSASPILQAIPSYWASNLPMMEHARETCVRLLSDTVKFIDQVVEDGEEEHLQSIKKLFGLAKMKTPEFLYYLSKHLIEWSSADIGISNTTIETYCSWVEGTQDENKSADTSDPLFRSLQNHGPLIEARASWSSRFEQTIQAMQSYSKGFRENLAPRYCTHGLCLDETFKHHHEPFHTNELYAWLICNDKIGGYVTGAPVATTSTPLVSRFVNYDFFKQECVGFFPTEPNGKLQNGTIGHLTAEAFNAYTGGWSPTNARRIIYSAGEMDIWREMSASAKLRPRGPMLSDPKKDIVVHLIKTGWHHSDLSTRNTELNEEVKHVRDQEVNQICRWVQQWPGYQKETGEKSKRHFN